jgi:hypothetical protein
MLVSQLRTIRRSATNLLDAIDTYDDVPAWVLTEVAVSLDDLVTVENYLLSRIEAITGDPSPYYEVKRYPPFSLNPSINPKEAKDYAGKVTRAVKAFGRGAKKAGVAAGRMTKIATLKTKITSEKSYQKNLIKYGKDLEVSAQRVKASATIALASLLLISFLLAY